jgi:hypothetical protein
VHGAARTKRLDQSALLPQRALHVSTGRPAMRRPSESSAALSTWARAPHSTPPMPAEPRSVAGSVNAWRAIRRAVTRLQVRAALVMDLTVMNPHSPWLARHVHIGWAARSTYYASPRHRVQLSGTGVRCTASASRASIRRRPPKGDRMRSDAKMSSGPEPVRQHHSEGRHAKASSPPGQDCAIVPAEPAEGAAGEPDLEVPGNETATSPLPRRVAGQSGVVAHPAGPAGVIRPARVSGGPPWEPAPKPPDMSYAPKDHRRHVKG